MHFEALLKRHRVTALAYAGLCTAGITLPSDVAASLARSALVATRNALVKARETLRLQRVFDEAAVPALFVKGSTLAILVYGSLGVKESWDIDLLTTPQKALAARDILFQLGYDLVSPAGLEDRKFRDFTKLSKEAIFLNRRLSVAVELHWLLVDNEYLLPGITAHSQAQPVPVGGGFVRTLQDEILFAYLCVHGTVHAWGRLKWLADVGAFLGKRSEAEIDRFYRAAIALGAGRCPAVALLLCYRLFGLQLPSLLLREIEASRITNALVANSFSALMHPAATPSVYSIANLRRLVARFFLQPRARYIRAEIRLVWTSRADRMLLNLPRRLTFLYHLLRVPLWLWRAGSRIVHPRIQ
ncbi:MAG: nucleotidyltransferase family protein [Sphingomonas sp.]|nr:nucleotidyltransferase family protein [Sphingomonas sp.]